MFLGMYESIGTLIDTFLATRQHSPSAFFSNAEYALALHAFAVHRNICP